MLLLTAKNLCSDHKIIFNTKLFIITYILYKLRVPLKNSPIKITTTHLFRIYVIWDTYMTRNHHLYNTVRLCWKRQFSCANCLLSPLKFRRCLDSQLPFSPLSTARYFYISDLWYISNTKMRQRVSLLLLVVCLVSNSSIKSYPMEN